MISCIKSLLYSQPVNNVRWKTTRDHALEIDLVQICHYKFCQLKGYLDKQMIQQNK